MCENSYNLLDQRSIMETNRLISTEVIHNLFIAFIFASNRNTKSLIISLLWCLCSYAQRSL